MMLDLIPGIAFTSQYEAWKFPGGEIHFKLKEDYISTIYDYISEWKELPYIYIRTCNAENIIFLAIVTDTLYKDFRLKSNVIMGYMPYQQADRDFGVGECFSLKTICNIFNGMPINEFRILDPHSDVTPALLNNAVVLDNSEFITHVLDSIPHPENRLVILSPDAGAYKKIFKLCENIGFNGAIETANKYRNTTNGEIQVRLSKEDFQKQDILIIDDICMGGRTFIELAKELRKRNCGKLYLAVSHGIFSTPLGGLDGLGSYFNEIFTTDSFRSNYDSIVETLSYQPNSITEECSFNVFKL